MGGVSRMIFKGFPIFQTAPPVQTVVYRPVRSDFGLCEDEAAPEVQLTHKVCLCLRHESGCMHEFVGMMQARSEARAARDRALAALGSPEVTASTYALPKRSPSFSAAPATINGTDSLGIIDVSNFSPHRSLVMSCSLSVLTFGHLLYLRRRCE